MPFCGLDVNLETPSHERRFLSHEVPRLKKIDVQSKGKTKRVGFVAMEKALSLPLQKH